MDTRSRTDPIARCRVQCTGCPNGSNQQRISTDRFEQLFRRSYASAKESVAAQHHMFHGSKSKGQGQQNVVSMTCEWKTR